MAIAESIAAIKTSFEIAKSIGEYVKQEKIDPNEILTRLLVLQEYMLQSQSGLNDAKEEIQQLKTELAKRDRWAEIEADMEYVEDGGFYIRKSEKAAGKHIAYCPLCLKAAKADVPLDPGGGRGCYRCGIHDKAFMTAAYEASLKHANRQAAERARSQSY